MFKFGNKSNNMLTGVHPDLQAVCQRALDKGIIDFSIIEGVRPPERQRLLVQTGASQTYNSKHLLEEDGYGHAVDIAPFPLNYRDTGSFYILNGIMRACAVELGIKIRTGCDWDMDGQTLDQTFNDIGHYELL